MKIKAKEVVAQDSMVQFPTDQVERAPIQDQDNEDIAPSSTTKLEHEYLASGLSYGDRLRLVNDSGQLVDVILMPNGQIAIQQLQLKIEYGGTTVYPTWEHADAQAQGYDFYKAIVAAKHFAKVIAILDNAQKTMNPYRK